MRQQTRDRAQAVLVVVLAPVIALVGALVGFTDSLWSIRETTRELWHREEYLAEWLRAHREQEGEQP